MIKSSFYTDRRAEKWERIGSIFWSGNQDEEPWKRTNGFLKNGYGRVDDHSKEVRSRKR